MTEQELIDIIARAIDPLVFVDDEEIAHRAASPSAVSVARIDARSKGYAVVMSLRSNGAVIDARPEVIAFADLMEAKLKLKDPVRDGNSWKSATPYELIEALREHATKLESRYVFGATKAQTAEDAVDIANFAMMVADISGALDKNKGASS